MKQPAYKFFLVGMGVAGLEEFITQGVLKDNWGGWIIPTIIAFLPFLILLRVISTFLEKRVAEWKAVLGYYAVAGSIGLIFEWFVIGLNPWSDPNLLQIPFQLGMFSFWGAVAFAPRLLLDDRGPFVRVRRNYRNALFLGMAAIYFLAFTVPKDAQFLAVIAAGLFLFIFLNRFYFAYIRILKC